MKLDTRIFHCKQCHVNKSATNSHKKIICKIFTNHLTVAVNGWIKVKIQILFKKVNDQLEKNKYIRFNVNIFFFVLEREHKWLYINYTFIYYSNILTAGFSYVLL